MVSGQLRATEANPTVGSQRGETSSKVQPAWNGSVSVTFVTISTSEFRSVMSMSQQSCRDQAAVQEMLLWTILGNGPIVEPREQATRAANARQVSGRRRFVDPTTSEREYTKAETEFMLAMNEYKRQSGRMFPTWSEVLEVLRDLGYEKVDEDDEARREKQLQT